MGLNTGAIGDAALSRFYEYISLVTCQIVVDECSVTKEAKHGAVTTNTATATLGIGYDASKMLGDMRVAAVIDSTAVIFIGRWTIKRPAQHLLLGMQR